MICRCNRRPFFEHAFDTFFLSLWIASWLEEPPAICVLHNEYNGFGTFSVFRQIDYRITFIYFDAEFTVIFPCFSLKIRFSEVMAFWGRLWDAFWWSFATDLRDYGLENVQENWKMHLATSEMEPGAQNWMLETGKWNPDDGNGAGRSKGHRSQVHCA